ncbi:putative carboxylesterase 8-like [Forsythia ovata]|uniref:Carboxylesterase 8-like n=1 Tax=Forsythia ovata TaxID=205694 RepID=A0ABD1WWW4_9LAMI
MENNNKIQSVVSNPDRELIQLTYIYKISRIHRQTSVQLSHYSGAYIRLYIPVNPPTETKLPLIIYLHGGDFVLFSASTVIFHDFCNNIATQFPAVVASVEYRLAPENQLPEAYEDALNAIFWVQSQAQGSPQQISTNLVFSTAIFTKVALFQPLENIDVPLAVHGTRTPSSQAGPADSMPDTSANGGGNSKCASEEEKKEENGEKKLKVDEKSVKEQQLESLEDNNAKTEESGGVSVGPKVFESSREIFDYFYKFLQTPSSRASI